MTTGVQLSIALTITQPLLPLVLSLDPKSAPTCGCGRRAVPQAEAELEPEQLRPRVRSIRAIEGSPHELTHRETCAGGFVDEERVLAVGEDHMCAPTHS